MFVHTSAHGTICELYFPVPLNTKEIRRIVILLNFALMKNEGKTDSDMMDTVAHEVAHIILGHHDIKGHDDPAGEKAADNLTEKWGFKRAYNNYKHFEEIAKFNKDKVNK